MSLQHAAHYLASQGRGPDDTLVHMTRREVQSLQDIARAHGGSLTINPETGLVEAGFLKNLLPMIAGMGITALTGGAAAPWMIGLGVGGIQAARTGSLEKGLMAGLGAYGGAGLGSALSAAGSTAAQEAAISSGGSQHVMDIASGEAAKQAAANPFSTMASGVQSLGTEAGRRAALGSLGGGFGAAKTAGMALAPAIMGSDDQKAPPADNERYNYSYNPGRVYNPNEGYTGAATGERTYFRPSYTRLPNSKGFADGGATDEQPVAQNFNPFSGNVPFAQAATPPAQVGGVQPVTSNPFYTMSGQSGDAYKYLMGQAPTSNTSQTTVTPPPQTITSPTTPNEVQTGTAGTTGTGPIEPPVRPPIIDPFEEDDFNFPVDVDPYDQNNQDAIDKYEEEVGNELYDQNNQDAIDKYEEEAANEQYDQNNQDAINKIEQEVTDEDETDERHGFINPNLPPEEEETTVNPTPEELINRDEFGNLDEVIADREYDQNNEDAINKYEEEIRNEDLIKEDPYGDLDAAIAENNARDFREASDIDDATISTDAATNNGAAEAAAREKEEAQRDEDRIINDYFGYEDYGSIAAGGGDYGGYENYGDVAAGGGDFGGGGGGGGRYMDQFDEMLAATGGLMAAHRYAMGGSTLGGYSDGGRLLRGPGDGVSDSIPATIGAKRQPARLADGEFVVPARIVSELGNGSTEAGARKLYAMMERIQSARGNTVGRNRVATNTRADRHLPA